jgi:hypothetical protein
MRNDLSVSDSAGLVVAVGDHNQLAQAAEEGAHIFRMRELPDRSTIAELQRHGYLFRPLSITWTGALLENEDEFVGTLSRNSRSQLRRAQRRAGSLFEQQTFVGMPPAVMLEWLDLYRLFMSKFSHPTNVALDERESLLEERNSYIGCLLRAEGKLIAGTLAKVQGESLRMRFFAQDPQESRLDKGSAARVCYMLLAQVGRDSGCSTMLLGNDPNLYGHQMSSNLHEFKSSLGFRPVPKESLYPGQDESVLERFIDVAPLSLPATTFVYIEPDATSRIAAATVLADHLQLPDGQQVQHFASFREQSRKIMARQRPEQV